MRKLYYPIEPHIRGRLRVSALHDIYYEVSGNPDGVPVVVCHGGPGGGTTPSMRRFFDPQRYRIVMFDQRGCGRSVPHADLRENTTWDLIGDMEALRTHLGIDRWYLFGGSWGSTLALAYALTHTDRTRGLVLRGIFTLRRSELEWFYQGGAHWIFPEAWRLYRDRIPEDERGDMMAAYYRRLTGEDEAEKRACARAWSVWEASTVSLVPSAKRIASFQADAFALAFARIECHYFVNGGFFERDGWIIEEAGRLAGVPGIIVQGRYDVVTPLTTALELHEGWEGSTLEIVPDAGHAASEPGIVDGLVRATDAMVADPEENAPSAQ